MTEYTVIKAETTEDLSEQVSDALGAGWTLHGSLVAIQGITGGHIYFQAVCR
jgi:hypothetical protein